MAQQCNMETAMYSVFKVKVLWENVFEPSNKPLMLTQPLIQ